MKSILLVLPLAFAIFCQSSASTILDGCPGELSGHLSLIRGLQRTEIVTLRHVTSPKLSQKILLARRLLSRTILNREGVNLRGEGHFVPGMLKSKVYLSADYHHQFDARGIIIQEPEPYPEYRTKGKATLLFTFDVIAQGSFSHISNGWSGGLEMGQEITTQNWSPERLNALNREQNELVFDDLMEFRLDQVRLVLRDKYEYDEVMEGLVAAEPETDWSKVVFFKYVKSS